MKPVIMPQVGQDIPSAAIVEWLKQEGDSVKKGETVLVIESDKATFEVEAEIDGVLLKKMYDEGDVVEIFKPVAYIGQPGEVTEVLTTSEESAAIKEPVAAASATPLAPENLMTSEVLASPAVRRLAREKNVNLSQLTGSGPGGRIVIKDVLSTLESAPLGKAPEFPAAAPAITTDSEDVEVFGKMRRRIAERMALSARTIPHFHLFIDVDMTAALMFRQGLGAQEKPSINDLVIQAVAKTLPRFPRVNAHGDDTQIRMKKEINIGVAVSVEDGLLVPVVTNADRLSLTQICTSRKQIAEAARRGVIETACQSTFTITSLGTYGISRFLPIINPPETAILGVGAMEERVVAINGEAKVCQMMTLTLGADHRAVDGAYAATFLKALKTTLETMEDLG